MKITTFGKIPGFNGTVSELIEALNLKEHEQDIMYTLTVDEGCGVASGAHRSSDRTVEFRAWTAPFRNFCKGHVNPDGAPDENRLFQIEGKCQGVLEAVRCLIEGKVEWQTVNEENRKVRLWLSRDVS